MIFSPCLAAWLAVPQQLTLPSPSDEEQHSACRCWRGSSTQRGAVKDKAFKNHLSEEDAVFSDGRTLRSALQLKTYLQPYRDGLSLCSAAITNVMYNDKMWISASRKSIFHFSLSKFCISDKSWKAACKRQECRHFFQVCLVYFLACCSSSKYTEDNQ